MSVWPQAVPATAPAAPPRAGAAWPDMPKPWLRSGAALLLVLNGLVLLYHQTAWSMVQIWLRSGTFAHCLLVLPLVLWLVWRQRGTLRLLVPRTAPAALPLVALASFAWLLGELAVVNALAQATLVALLVLAVAAVPGWQVARCLAFPLSFLFFAVPLGEFLLPQLMAWTADFTVFALRMSGIPVFREGNSFVIPSGNWSVVEACSGVRYLIASFMLGTLFAYLNFQSLHRRLLFVLVSLLVPLVANWLRAYFIVLLGHVSNNRIATGVDHLLYGWLFFGVVIGLMFLVGARWAEDVAPPPSPIAAAVPLANASANRTPTADSPGAPWRMVLLLLLVAAAPHLALWAMDASAAAPARVATTSGPLGPVLAPDLGKRWPQQAQQQMALLPALEPAYQNPTLAVRAGYGTAQRPVGLYIALYRNQRRGHSLVGSDNALVTSTNPHWLQVAGASQALKLGRQTITLRSSTLHAAERPGAVDHATAPTLAAAAAPPAGSALLVWQIYWVHGHLTASDFLAKAWSAWSRLTGQPDDAAVLLVYTRADPVAGAAASTASASTQATPAIEATPGTEASATLAAFWADNFRMLDLWLRRAANSPGISLQEAT